MQFKFGFTSKPAFSESDFVISSTNREAFFWIKKWPEWPGGALYTHGPEASGKTHLAHIWSAKNGARFLHELPEDLNFLSNEPTVIMENIESHKNEAGIFHLLNQVKEKKGFILITSKFAAGDLPFSLPDLTSRIKAMPSVAVKAPDDALLKSVIMKLFSDRQLKIPNEVIDFLIARIERSFKAANIMVEKIDNLSALEKRNITIPLVKKVLV